MDLIIFDYEVYKYDTLLGCIVVKDDKLDVFQTWDLKKMNVFYEMHKRSLWVGHNNDSYDNHILKYIIQGGKDVYKKSKSLINQKIRGKANLDILVYDLMCCRYYSLKMTELLVGKAIHTTDVDFDIDRPLTVREKQLVEDYNYDDLEQTYMNFLELKDQMMLRLNLLSEFHIDKSYFTATEAKLATLALGAKQIPGLEDEYLPPIVYDTLQVKNKDVMNFYLSEGFRKGQNIKVMLCGVEHTMGAGGIHAAKKKYHQTNFLYLDVSGYYNLVMINYDLLPRTIPQKGKDLYKYMYEQQLLMKGKPEMTAKRIVYKTILLSVFGASMNEYTDFYDPQVGSLITIVGQMFIVDLLEKLDGKVDLIQSNTDGIMVKPLPGYTDEDILAIVKEWCNRTGFVIKPKKIDKIFQRDVNCYCYTQGDNWEVKGDAFTGAFSMSSPVLHKMYERKEPAVITMAVKQFFIDNKSPEQTVEEYKDKLTFFQLLCKKGSYEYCEYETTNLLTGEKTSTRIGDLNRAFAFKDENSTNVIKKYKHDGKTLKCSKLPNMPDNYFIYNDEITSNETIQNLQSKIDYDWYIDRIYKRIQEFLPQIKEVTL